MLDKLREMIRLQDTFNETTTKEWKQANLDWCTYIVQEGAEAQESFHYKHWKAGKDDIDNYKVELVDIFHFIMSMGLVRWSQEELAEKFHSCYMSSNNLDNVSRTQRHKRFLYSVLSYDFKSDESDYNVAVITLFSLMGDVGLDLNKLYTDYIVKNCLNRFRQDNGYKEGTYRKMWNHNDKELEDNVVAYRLAKDLSYDELYIALDKEYKKF